MRDTIRARDAHLIAQKMNGYYKKFLPKISELIRKNAEHGLFSVKVHCDQLSEDGLNRTESLTIEAALKHELTMLGYKVVDAIDMKRAKYMNCERRGYLFTVYWKDL